jgi:hypothetical protein
MVVVGPEIFAAISAIEKVLGSVIVIASNLANAAEQCHALVAMLKTLQSVLKDIRLVAQRRKDDGSRERLYECL